MRATRDTLYDAEYFRFAVEESFHRNCRCQDRGAAMEENGDN